MSNLIKGSFQGKPTKYEFGIGKRGAEVRIDFAIVGGDHANTKVPYNGNFTAKGVKYTKRALIALGWTGKDIKTAEADIMTSPRTVPIEIEIATWKKDDGTVKEWSTVRSVGNFGEPLKPADASTLGDVNQWLAEVEDEKPTGDDSAIPF